MPVTIDWHFHSLVFLSEETDLTEGLFLFFLWFFSAFFFDSFFLFALFLLRSLFRLR